jgi:hypothetical protein
VAGHIVLAAAKQDTKFAVTNVEYQELPENRFKVVATDTKILAILEGGCPDSELHPAEAKLAASPNGCSKTLIPADIFARVMKPLKVGKSHPKRTVLETTGIAASETIRGQGSDVNTVTFIASDGKGDRVEQVQVEQARFPECDHLFPKKAPAFRIKVPVDQMMKLLAIAGKVGEMVTLDFYGSGKQMILTSKSPDSDLSFSAICMPVPLQPSEELAKEEDQVEPAISSKRFDRGGPYEHETD